MLRDYRLYLDDIVIAVAAIRDYTAGYNYEQFVADRKTMDAVLHNLAIIGEAASKLPAEIQQKAPEVEWRKIVDFRNIVIHEYFGVNRPIVWDIISNKLAPLAEICHRLLQDDNG
jgi:uncharacterized protein with HEPN domain